MQETFDENTVFKADVLNEPTQPDFDEVIDSFTDDFRVNQLVAAAVTGLLANPTVPNNPKEVARMAVVQAKAVIDELDGE